MADKITLFELDIDLNASLKNSEDMRKSVTELKKGLKELTDAEKENNKAIDEQTKKLNELKNAENQNVTAIAEAESQMNSLQKTRDGLNSSIVNQTSVLKVNQKELSQNEKLTQDIIKAEEAASGSIEQQRRQLSIVSAEWAKLSEEERKNTEEGKKLTAQKLELTEKLKEEEKATGDTRRNVGNYANDILKAVDALTQQRTVQEQNIRELEAASKSSAKGSVEQKKYDLALVQTKKDLAATTNELEKYDEEVEDANEGTGKLTGGLGLFGGAAGGAIGGMKGIGAAANVMLGPVGLVVAAIALVVGALKSFFSSSEEGQNTLKRLGAIFDTVVGNIVDILSILGEAIVLLVTKPQEALQFFKDRISEIGDFFSNTFGNIIGGALTVFVQNFLLTFDKIALAWNKLKDIFTDNADGVADAQEKINERQDSIIEGMERVKTGANNLKDAVTGAYADMKKGVSDFIAEQEREIAIAQRLADREANLTKARRRALVLVAKSKDEINRLLLSTRDETLSYAERLEAIKKSNDIKTKEIALQKQIALENYEIIKSQNTLSNSTIEDLDKEAQALAEFYNVQATGSAQLRKLKTEENKLNNQLQKEQEGARKKDFDDAKKQAEKTSNLLQIELNDYRQSFEIKGGILADFNKEALRLENELAAQRLETGLTNQETYNEALKENQIAFEQSEEERIKEIALTDLENKNAIANDNILSSIEIERQKLELQREQEIEFAESIGVDIELVKSKFRKADLALDQASFNARASLAGDFAGNLITIFGKNSKIGKAAAISQATISAIVSANQAYSAVAGIPIVGPVLGVTAAAAALAAGFANVKSIVAVKTPGVSDAGVSAPTAPSIPSSPININPEIGQGIATRESFDTELLNDSINNQISTNTLVEGDVTNKQKKTVEQETTAVI